MKLKIASILVLLMAILQGFYAIYAFVDPAAFSTLRGTVLASTIDADWVIIYASRTLFIAFVVGLLLYYKKYRVLIFVALFGTVMPITDAWLAYQAEAPAQVVLKHIITIAYLVITALLLFYGVRKKHSGN